MQTLSCQIAAHLSWAPPEVTCRNEEHHENAERDGNIDSSAGGNSAYLSLDQNVCRRIQMLMRTCVLRVAYSLASVRPTAPIARLQLTLFSFSRDFNFQFHTILLIYRMHEST
jgi:hypothetical protein